jgi:hypothetical protein
LGLGLISVGTMAQSLTGSVFGRAAPGANTTVVIHNVNTGQELTTAVDSAGRYRFASLPAGTYTVILREGASNVSTRDNVPAIIAGGTEVSFAGGGVTDWRTYRCHYCGLAGSGTSPTLTDGWPNPSYVAPSADYKFSPRGRAGDTLWTYQLNLNASYTPAWANGNLELALDVINVLNQQTAQWYDTQYAANRVTRSRYYGQELNYTSPRQFRLTARYDFSL